MEKNVLYQKALAYVVNGYSIIPLRKNKIPLLSQNIVYQRERQPTEDEVELWWKQNPQANIGICTGKISGITVVDIDMFVDGNNIQGVSLDTFPATYTVQTPTGGYHLYYQYDQQITQTANTYKQFPHVDIRNDGGYVVAPPSHCDYIKNKKRVTGTYKIINNIPIAPFPRELFILKPSEINRKEKIQDVLKRFPTLAEGDGRNNALTKVVGKVLKLVSKHEYEDVAYPMVLSANKQFKNPLPEKEVRTIFDSIATRESKKPLADVEFLTTDKGGIIVNEENVYRTVKNDPELRNCFRTNIFNGSLETNFECEGWETLQRSHIINVRMYLMRTYPHFIKVNHSTVEDSIIRFLSENKVSPPAIYLSNLVWDKVPRLDTWLCDTYNVEDNKYHRATGANWMKGLVKRIVEPGSKFDYVLVLEGRQGTRKSTSLAVLGGDWHVETVFTPDNKDFFMLFSGKAIVEFSEGETLSRTEAKRLKAIITMQFDKYRPPYERSAKEFPRQCVFAMTTNQEEYLKDETGNRRWLPVACQGVVNIEWLKENREQLFAEAYHRVVTLKETTYEFPEEETREQQVLRQIADPMEEQIYLWYSNLSDKRREEGITTRMAYTEGVHRGLTSYTKDMGKIEQMIIGNILREGLRLSRKRTSEGAFREYRYYLTDETKKLLPKRIDDFIEGEEIDAESIIKKLEME